MSQRKRSPRLILDDLSELLSDGVMNASDEDILRDGEDEHANVSEYVQRLRDIAFRGASTTQTSAHLAVPSTKASPDAPSKYLNSYTWTNRSVRKLANEMDPITVIEDRARSLAARAMDQGWSGPPYDPIRLAELLGFTIQPRPDVRDATVQCLENGRFKIDFNPNRPQARINFSIAHEIAHTLFPDCREQVRYRGKRATNDDWQVEVLCNIAAAELLMPVGSFRDLQALDPSIETLLDVRKQFRVSAEAVLIRYAKLTDRPCAAFGASANGDGNRRGAYRLDYMIPSRTWPHLVRQGAFFAEASPVTECVAIGFTAKGLETGLTPEALHIEAVGLPPYPTQVVPRVVGLLSRTADAHTAAPRIVYLKGNALEPRGAGKRIIAHVVNDKTPNWGGRGFAAAVRKKWPEVHAKFAFKVVETDRALLKLGSSDWYEVNQEISVFTMVAQHGYGPSPVPRIRYGDVEAALAQLRHRANAIGASVHMPRIGAGHAGGAWEIIEGLIFENLVLHGVPVTVYDLPE